MKKIILLSLCFTSFFLHAQSWRNFGGDPDHHRQSRRATGHGLSVSQCIYRDYNGSAIELNEKFLSFETALDFISITKTGDELVRKFKEKNINISLLTDAGRRRLGSSRAAAIFNFAGKRAKVYVDKSFELGILAITLFHEMVHAIDPLAYEAYFQEVQESENYSKVWKEVMTEAIVRENQLDLLDTLDQKEFNRDQKMRLDEIQKRLTYSEKNKLNDANESYQRLKSQLNYQIERKAFDEQNIFLKELKSIIPCFESYIEEHKKVNGLKLEWSTSDDHIFKLYPDINKNYIRL